jgi:hypothetical protein
LDGASSRSPRRASDPVDGRSEFNFKGELLL